MKPDYFDKDYFDGGKGYHQYNDDQRFQADAKMIVDRFNPKSVLDFGAAKGYLVKALIYYGIEVWGYEVSEYAREQAPDGFQPLISDTWRDVDLIVSFDTLEHIAETDLPALRDNFRRYGKRFYFKVATPETPNWEHDASHITIKPLGWWQAWMPEATFEVSK